MAYKLLENNYVPVVKTEDVEEYTMDEINPFNNNLRADGELFKDEDSIPNTVIQVKRTEKSKDGEVWKILENGKLVLSIGANRFSNKEKDFLRTAKGFRYLIDGYKEGWRTINKFKQNIKV